MSKSHKNFKININFQFYFCKKIVPIMQFQFIFYDFLDFYLVITIDSRLFSKLCWLP